MGHCSTHEIGLNQGHMTGSWEMRAIATLNVGTQNYTANGRITGAKDHYFLSVFLVLGDFPQQLFSI